MTGLAAYLRSRSHQGSRTAPPEKDTLAMRPIPKITLGLAAVALGVTPASAAELPRVAVPQAQADYAPRTVLNDGADEAHNRRYRYHRRDRDRIDAGDVIAGALIIGGIFAIASAASSNNDRYDRDYLSNDDFDRAVDRCVRQVERGQRIGSVDNVGRTRAGYSVSGTLYDGTPFACQVSGSGRVLDVDYGYGGVRYQSGGEVYGEPRYGDRQYSDDAYARARSQTYSAPAGNAQPAYPGGPLPGEDYGEDPYAGDDGDYPGEPY